MVGKLGRRIEEPPYHPQGADCAFKIYLNGYPLCNNLLKTRLKILFSYIVHYRIKSDPQQIDQVS